MKPRRVLLAVSATVVLLWGGYRAYRAHANLVTLSVRNMDVRRVVSKIEWQTWERIVVNTNVSGRVTLNVRSIPLDEVLNIVALQTDARWTRLYPIYSTRKSIATFHKVLRGELVPARSGWTSLQTLGAWQQVNLGGFANTLRAENKLVSAQILNKDPSFAALALSRFSKAQVVLEDHARGTINLKLQQVPFEKAVARVAKQVRRSWDRVYALQPLNTVSVVRQDNGGKAETNQVAAVRAPDPLPPEVVIEAIAATMTPEERQQAQDQLANASQAAALSPAERQQQRQAAASQAAQAAQGDLERRIQNRLKNGTVDQRVARDRRQLPKQQSGQQP